MGMQQRGGWTGTSGVRLGLGLATLLFSGASAEPLGAQTRGSQGLDAITWLSRSSHVVVPQARGFSFERDRSPIQIESVDARVKIVERAAATTLEIALRNPAGRDAEAVLLLPVPDGAAVGSFLFEGAAAEPTAELLPADLARRTYDEIVARIKDPALLEFAGYGLIRSSVFPVPAGGTQRVRITYEHLLDASGERIDYVLPRSESLAAQVPWNVSVEISAATPISMVYSPSHDYDTLRRDPRHLELVVRDACVRDPGPFLLSILLERDGLSASLVAYPDPEVGGGYFLLMAGLPVSHEEATKRIPREVTLVLDRSGSMAGEKLDQALAAARQVIEGLDDGEAFNVIDYSSQVAMFAPQPVIKDRESIERVRAYLASIRAQGGTNIHDALVEALRQEPNPGMLSLVLFLTDGLPTVGNTSEVAIRARLEEGNAHGRRVFTFGVGNDVNVPLLDRLSDATRATSTFVLPGEDVEVKVAAVFRRLHGPVLAGLALGTRDEGGGVTTRAVRELMPERLPDLFEGDQLLVLGQYREEGPLRFTVSGNYLGTPRSFEFSFGLAQASTRNAFVPRLWATRKIAALIDEIRQAGAAAAGAAVPGGAPLLADPRYKELAEEILRLSSRFGVLSEYTAFLAREGTDLGDWNALQVACDDNLERRAVWTRYGAGAVNQGRNFNANKLQAKLAYDNRFWNESNEVETIGGVQQLADRCFFQRGGDWIDGRLVGAEIDDEALEVIEFGSARHKELVSALVDEGRQGVLSLPGRILLRHADANVLVENGVGR
ncbi:MAG: VIT and VWA domain-containing protein [Planctomycetota bacterium]|nr:VIT and VWA domain-containing protein [Planctomycetota bacterium]MDP6761703.1 VIT and VWA domain-containing protein [Planctomycetota bacterium]